MLHNGDGGWDNAEGVPGRNYVAMQSGSYRLADGQLMLLPPRLPLMLARARAAARGCGERTRPGAPGARAWRGVCGHARVRAA